MTDTFDDLYHISSPNMIVEQSESVDSRSTNSSNSSSEVSYYELDIFNGNMQLLFIIIATVTTLICLTICISVCVYICCSRHRKSKRPRMKGCPLLLEHSDNRLPPTNSITKTVSSTYYSTNKQPSEKKTSLSSTNIISAKTPYFYDNLDDIPFIDESRPTSYIDITRV